MRVGICGSHWLFLSLMNALSPVKPSMAPSPGALRIGLNDIRINGHTGVRDGFCFFKNESLTYSFYFLLLFLYLFSHTYHDFDHLIHLSFRELLWCNSLIYVYANWSAAYDNEIIKKKQRKTKSGGTIMTYASFFISFVSSFSITFSVFCATETGFLLHLFLFLLNGYMNQREFFLSSLFFVLHRKYSIFFLPIARHLFYGYLLLTRTNKHRREKKEHPRRNICRLFLNFYTICIFSGDCSICYCYRS